MSIVVPTHSRVPQLTSCLRAIARLDYPRGSYEVIVVDDDSTEPPHAALAAVAGDLEMTLSRQPRAGPARARNTGAALAKGEYLAFLDDDCAPAPGWLAALAARWRTAPGAIVGGRTVNGLPGNPYAAASQALVSYLYEYYGEESRKGRFFTTNNFALPARLFREVGGFDAGFPHAAAEDRELCDRCRRLGVELLYAADAIVLHSNALGLRTFLRQHYTYGRGALRFHTLCAELHGERIRIEPPSFYLGLLAFPFDGGPSRPRAVVSALLALSQVANALGFFSEKARAR